MTSSNPPRRPSFTNSNTAPPPLLFTPTNRDLPFGSARVVCGCVSAVRRAMLPMHICSACAALHHAALKLSQTAIR